MSESELKIRLARLRESNSTMVAHLSRLSEELFEARSATERMCAKAAEERIKLERLRHAASNLLGVLDRQTDGSHYMETELLRRVVADTDPDDNYRDQVRVPGGNKP